MKSSNKGDVMKKDNVKRNWWMTFILGLLLIILGITAMCVSNDAWKVLVIIAGAGLFFNGICNLFSIGASIPLVRKWVISDAIIDILLGVLMIMLPWLWTNIISWVIGVLMIVYGIGMLVEVIAIRPKSVIWRLLIVSIVSIALGILFIMDPSSFAKTSMIIIGIPLVVIGLGLCVGSAVIRFKPRKMTDEEIEDVEVTTYEQDPISSNDDNSNN